MQPVVLILLLAFAIPASAVVWPALHAAGLRKLFRAWPDARDAFVGDGSWISFSRRYGRPYALAALAIAFAWVLVGARIVPDTTFGVWLLFGPATLLLVLSVCLAALVVCRWVVDD